MITSIEVNYTGPYIYLNNMINISDVEVYAIDDEEDNHILLNTNQYMFNTRMITTRGVNTIRVVENITGQQFSATFDVYGVCIIFGLTAEYVGPDIQVSDKFDPIDVIVTIETLNLDNEKENIILKYGEDYSYPFTYMVTDEYLIEGDLIIKELGFNPFTIIYKDPVYDLSTDIQINGISKLVDFSTEYVGPSPRLDGDILDKSEVQAIAIYLMNIDGTTESKVLDSKDWSFIDAPILSDLNKGVLRTKYETFASYIEIAYESPQTLRLRCWYEGVKIKVGSSYDYNDVVAILIFPNGNTRRLRTLELEFETRNVPIDGWNLCSVKYINEKIKVKGYYAVPGYKFSIPEEKDFMVQYIDRNNDRLIDYTKKFEEAFTIDDIIYISWTKFLAQVNDMELYGKYILTAPMLCGLSNRLSEAWEVLCINKDTLKANVLESFKEDKQIWLLREQLKHQITWSRTPKQP